MGYPAARALLIGFLALAPGLHEVSAQPRPEALGTECPPQPRAPLGIYVVPVETVVKTYAAKKDLIDFYTGLLNNPAVAGLTLPVHWDTLNPNPPVSRKSPDTTAPSPKTIQLIVSPGFNAPQWVREPAQPGKHEAVCDCRDGAVECL